MVANKIDVDAVGPVSGAIELRERVAGRGLFRARVALVRPVRAVFESVAAQMTRDALTRRAAEVLGRTRPVAHLKRNGTGMQQ